MVLDVYLMDDLFDMDFIMIKVECLDFGESLMIYVMVLIGVDLVDG